MKRRIFKPRVKFGYIEATEGETIETKVERVTTNNEPISDGAEIIYTERKDGVLPQYDIRTDKWDIAQDAMNNVNATKIAKSKETLKQQEETKDNGTAE